MLAASGAGGPAVAADLTINVVDAKGAPVREAVVTFTPSGGADIPAKVRNAPYVMSQKNLSFIPNVLPVPVGATVSFPNQDNVRHHVYSLSPVHPFQLPLYGPGQTRFVEFDQIGTISLACDIHDSMGAYIRVVDTPWFASTGADGRAVLKDVPAGAGRLGVWHPSIQAAGHDESRTFTMGNDDDAEHVSVKTGKRMTMPGM